MALTVVLNHIGVATTSVVLVLLFCLQSYTAWKRYRLFKLVNEGLRNGKRYRLKAAFAPVGTQQRIIYIFGLAMSVLLAIRSIDPLATFAFDDGWLRLLTFNTGSLLMVGALISLRSQLRLWIVMKRKDIAYWSRNVFRFLGVATILLTNVCFFLFIGLPSASANWGFVAYFFCVMVLETAMVIVWNFIVYQLRRSVDELKKPRPEMRIDPQEANELDTLAADSNGPQRPHAYSHVVSKPLSDTNSPRDDHAHHSRLSNGSLVHSHHESHEHAPRITPDMPTAQSSSSELLQQGPEAVRSSSVVISVAQPPPTAPSAPSVSLAEKGTVVEDRNFFSGPLTRAPSLTSTSLQSFEGGARRKSFFGRKTSTTTTASMESTAKAMQKLRKFNVIVHVCWMLTMVYQGFAIRESFNDMERKRFVFPQDMYPMYACIVSGFVCLWYGWQRNTMEVFRLNVNEIMRAMDEEEQSRDAPNARAPPNYSAEGGSRSGRNAADAGVPAHANGKDGQVPVTFSALHGTGGHAAVAEQANDSNSGQNSKDSFGGSSFN